MALELTDAQFYGSFHLRKVKTSRLRYQNLRRLINVSKREICLLPYHMFQLHLTILPGTSVMCEITSLQEIDDGMAHRYSCLKKFACDVQQVGHP